MDGCRRKMNCIARRTRSKWDDYYYKTLHNEFKRKNLSGDGVGGNDKRDVNDSEHVIFDVDSHEFVVCGEKGCDGVISSRHDEISGRRSVQKKARKFVGLGDVLEEEEKEDGNEGFGDHSLVDEDLDARTNSDGDGVSKSDGVGILERNEYQDYEFAILNNRASGGGGGDGFLKINEDEFNGAGILNSLEDGYKDDDGIMEIDEEEFNIAFLKASANCGGIGISKIDKDEWNGAGILKSDKDAYRGVEKVEIDDDVSAKKDECVDSDGIEILSDEDEDGGIEMLKAGGGGGEGSNDNRAKCSSNISVDSVTEDSDKSVDMHVSESESESTSEFADEEEGESSTSESSDESYCGSDDEGGDELENTDESSDELENTDESGDELENTDERVRSKEKKSDKVGDIKRTELGKGSPEKDDKDDEGDQLVKSSGVRNGRISPEKGNGGDLERGDEVKKMKLLSVEQSSRKKQKGDDKEEPVSVFKSPKKEPELKSCNSPLPVESPSTIDVEKESSSDIDRKNFRTVKQSPRKKRKGNGEEEPIPVSKSRKREPQFGNCSSPLLNKSAATMDDEQASLNDVSRFFSTPVVKTKLEKPMFSSKKSRSVRDLDLIKILLDSINSVKQKQCSIDEKALAENSLPLKFRFGDEEVPPPEKSEWEKHIDALFSELELVWLESETSCSNFPKMKTEDLKTTKKIDDSPAASCRRGGHQAVLDEQIGLVCEFCSTVIMDIKYILPPFVTPTWNRRNKKACEYEESPISACGDIKFQGSPSSATDSTNFTYGTVWDLIPGVKRELYPHQREGFEFMWKNLAGGIIIEKLNKTLADDARGCIISHAPGTGKTRLTIEFLRTFLKMYPTCSPMIMAPRGTLLTWEAEFKKWNVNIAFHNLNNKDNVSGEENAVDTGLLGQVGYGALSIDCIRLMKLYSWAKGGSVLGISYPLFEKLTGTNVKQLHHEKMREMLLQRPGLLVLDEGHTPRNDKSQIWKVLKNVSTQRRIILSGTPFQNSLQELCNTVCVANPKFANQIDHRRRLTSSSNTNRDEVMKMKALLDPLIHVHKGTILEESLPGLRHTLVFLHPSESQKVLLQNAWKEKEFLHRLRLISLISVHPSAAMPDGNKPDINEGVKTRFLLKLIQFSIALGDRVLVFSQYIDSLVFIKEQLLSSFSWYVGREVLYMDGKLDDRRRQDFISSFNDDTSEAKVLLASVKACSEGISLIGASRVVLLDTVWNPSVEKQAICRAYRLGQKKVVHVYRLFTSGVEVRLGQYPCQLHKEQVSRWLFSLGKGCQGENSAAVSVDRVMEALLNHENFKIIFDKVLFQPNESDIIEIFRV